LKVRNPVVESAQAVAESAQAVAESAQPGG